MKNMKSSFLFSSGFAGGLLTGFFISSLKKPDIFKNQRQSLEGAISRISQAVKEGNERLKELNNQLKKELSHPIPDLYRATESLSLDEEELIYE